jgi:hypothetical protein
MKLPNLRLHETQAWVSALFGAAAIFGLLVLSYVVFKGFDWEMKAINFNPNGGLGKYRKILVFAGGALTMGVGLTAGLMGFNSLGQKRNTKQGMSWLGMALGAVSVAVAPVLLFAWMELSQAIIRGG